MNSSTEKLCERLDLVADRGESVDIWRQVGDLTMAVVGSSAYGVDLHTLDLDTDVSKERLEGHNLVEAAKIVFRQGDMKEASVWLGFQVGGIAPSWSCTYRPFMST